MPDEEPSIGEDATQVCIPPQYRGMPAEIVEELWQKTVFLDPVKTREEENRRSAALAVLRANEAQQAHLDATAGNRIRAELGLPPQSPSSILSPDELKEMKNKAFRCIRKDPEANFLGLIGWMDEQGNFHNTSINWRIGQRFDAHGISKGTKTNPTIGGELDSLLHFLQFGIVATREFHSAPLEVDPETRAGVGAGLGTSGTAYQDGSFILLSDVDEQMTTGGIRYIIVNPAYHHAIPRLQQAFPHVEFIPSDKANECLARAVAEHDRKK